MAKKSNVMETLKEMKSFAGYMKKMNEDYFMDDEMGGPEMGPEQMHPSEMQPQQQQEVDPKAQEDAEKINHANQVLREEPIIGKIREVAIEGLKKYSDQPTSKNYTFFKKVFLDSDKVLTDNGND